MTVADRADHVGHHHPPVQRREILRPADRLDIIVEMVGPFREIGEVLVRQVDEPFAHVLLRQLDEEAADRVADAARARMEHHPHAVRLVEAELDEVVAGAERAEMDEVVRLLELRIFVGDRA